VVDAKIIKFKFKISTYDVFNKEIPKQEELICYYWEQQIIKEQKSFFKISILESKIKYKGNINKEYNKKQIKLTKTNLLKEFEISNSTNFIIDYMIYQN